VPSDENSLMKRRRRFRETPLSQRRCGRYVRPDGTDHVWSAHIWPAVVDSRHTARDAAPGI
jgi:hypothetical protein